MGWVSTQRGDDLFIASMVFRGVVHKLGRDTFGRFWIYYWKWPEPIVEGSQKRAIQNYRSRLDARGLARFEVLGRNTDRDLIRSLARRLSEDTPEASEFRATVRKSIAGDPPKPGGILAALRRSPLVGAELDLPRPREQGRKVEL